MSTRIRAAARRTRLFLVPLLAMSGCLLVEPPSALKSHSADGNGGAAGSDATNTGGSGASGKTGATAGSGGRVGGASGNMPAGDGAGAAGESSAASGGGATTAGAGGSSAGQNSGGMHAGGTTAGGSTGGGGAPTGGSAGSAGASTGGSAGTSVGGGGAGGGSAAPSKGCTVTDGLKTLTTGGSSVATGLPTSTALTITSGGMSREYVIDIPADYNPTHPYRLIFSWHQAYGSDVGNASGVYPANNGPNFNATNYAFFGLRREANAANDSAIFVAPLGIGSLPWDYNRDVVLFDDLLTLIDANLCIDDNRVFSSGFSFGAMMSYALSITRQTKLRAVVAMAAVNYNLPGEPTDSNAAPIAYMGTTGMSDTTCPWVGSGASKGGQYCVLAHAQDNGCTIPANIPTTTVLSKSYLCYDFQGCAAGYPVKVCTFDGAHTPSSVDDGTSTGDDGLQAFIPPLAWKFIAQF